MFRRLRTLCGFFILAALLSVNTAGRSEEGTWVDVGGEDSLRTGAELPRLGEGLYLDDGEAAEFAGEAVEPDYATKVSNYFLYGDSLGIDGMDDLFLPPPLEFESRRLQDILLDERLPEEENYSLTDIFRQDSTMAISLMQLRGEEYPHYHLLSDLWIYIWRGRGQLTIEERELEYGPGQFFQIPAGVFHAFANISGAPTVGLVWQRPCIVDSLVVEVIPEEVLEQMRLDSLRLQNLQERTIYKSR